MLLLNSVFSHFSEDLDFAGPPDRYDIILPLILDIFNEVFISRLHVEQTSLFLLLLFFTPVVKDLVLQIVDVLAVCVLFFVYFRRLDPSLHK